MSRIEIILDSEKTSLRELAQRVGVTHNALHLYAKGKSEPKLSVALAIADAAGVSLDWLAGREGARREYAPLAGAGGADDGLTAADSGGGGAFSASSAAMDVAVYTGASRPLDYLVFRADYLRGRLQIDPAELLVVPVDTDDAAPALRSGGVCICHVRAALAAGGLWAVELDSAVTYRRLFATGSGVAIYRPDSAPGAAPLETIPTKAARRRAIGKVVWGGERFFN